MRNYIEVLYEESDHDVVFSYLKSVFGDNTKDVEVQTHVPDEFVRIEWDDLACPNSIAEEMTNKIPTVIIETQSNGGIEDTARYFNGAQLW